MENTIDNPTKAITGGFLVPAADSHLGKWQIEEDRLDHDNFLPPFVVSKLKEGDCVIDLGAFNGDHSIAYSRAVGPKGMVIAVEPGALAFECLKHNASLFEHKNVFPIFGAVSDFCGESIAHTTDENLGASTVQIIPREKLVEGQKYLMTVTIDYLSSFPNLGRIAFIKMDIEGFEVKALIGGSKVLRDHKPMMLIEVNEGALAKQGSTPEEIFEILLLQGYDWEIVQPELDVHSPQFDIFCKPKENKLFIPQFETSDSIPPMA